MDAILAFYSINVVLPDVYHCHYHSFSKTRDVDIQHIPRRWIVFFAQSDWFLYLGILCTIPLQAKQDGVQFCFVTKEENCYE